MCYFTLKIDEYYIDVTDFSYFEARSSRYEQLVQFFPRLGFDNRSSLFDIHVFSEQNSTLEDRKVPGTRSIEVRLMRETSALICIIIFIRPPQRYFALAVTARVKLRSWG